MAILLELVVVVIEVVVNYRWPRRHLNYPGCCGTRLPVEASKPPARPLPPLDPLRRQLVANNSEAFTGNEYSRDQNAGSILAQPSKLAG